MKARIESLERTLLRAAGIAARRGCVGTRECGPVPRFLLTIPPPNHCNLINLRPSRAPLYAFSYETAADLFSLSFIFGSGTPRHFLDIICTGV